MASNCSQDWMPLVSVRSTWSTEMPTSSPATALPDTRWLSISLRVRLLFMGAGSARPARSEGGLSEMRSGCVARSSLPDGHERSTAGADVVGAGTDQPVVVVLLDDVGAPSGDASGRDDGGEEVDGDAERVE